MAGNEVYLERGTGTGYRVDLAPINIIEDSYAKNIDPYPLEISGTDNPITGVRENKLSFHRLVVSGELALTDGDTTNGVTTLSGLLNTNSKIGRLHILYGYGNVDSDASELTFSYDGDTYNCWMTKKAITKHAGNRTYTYVMELLVGTHYDNI